MIRAAMLSMMLGLMALTSGEVLAGEELVEREKSLDKELAVVALSASEREDVDLAANLFVEMADQGLYKELWLGMAQGFQDENAYRNFETILAFRKKSLQPIDYRKLVFAEAFDAGSLGLERGRFALVVFCTRSEGMMFMEAIVMMQKVEREWTVAKYDFEVEGSTSRDEEQEVNEQSNPCAYLNAGNLGA